VQSSFDSNSLKGVTQARKKRGTHLGGCKCTALFFVLSRQKVRQNHRKRNEVQDRLGGERAKKIERAPLCYDNPASHCSGRVTQPGNQSGATHEVLHPTAHTANTQLTISHKSRAARGHHRIRSIPDRVRKIGRRTSLMTHSLHSARNQSF